SGSQQDDVVLGRLVPDLAGEAPPRTPPAGQHVSDPRSGVVRPHEPTLGDHPVRGLACVGPAGNIDHGTEYDRGRDRLVAPGGDAPACRPNCDQSITSRNSPEEGEPMDAQPVRFPSGFQWGVATSAYQIEGATTADGRGESIWDRFSATPGRTAGGDTGKIACDHYHRWEQDLDLLADLGVDAYRFSIAWPRIHPDGGNAVNRPGIDFYDRLVDGLLERGIRPTPTLYHWDLPQVLQDRGGWTSRDTVGRFADYAQTMFAALGDRVTFWMTHNEPWMASFIAHLRAVPAPGVRALQAALRAAHHILLSHGESVRAFRASGRPGEIGIALNLQPTYPATDSDTNRDAAWGSDGYTNRWFLDPLYHASYPADTAERFESAGGLIDFVVDGDHDTIAAPTDFVGVNYYSRRRISA